MGAVAIEGELPVGLDAEVAQLRRGDPDALAALLARYQNRLYRYLLRMVRDPAAAEDLFQQTWLRVAQNIRRFDPRHNFEAWFFRIARNLAIDHLRRYLLESLDEPLSSGDSRSEALPAAGPSALDQVIERERRGHVAAAMATLPMLSREVLTLRFEEEMKLEEIAALLEIPLSTAKSRLRRALDGLRMQLANRYPEGEWP